MDATAMVAGKWMAGLALKARAILGGRYIASVEDVRALARPVLRHRVLPNFTAESEGLTSVKLIDRLLEQVRPPTAG